jgi:hypothetical protein
LSIILGDVDKKQAEKVCNQLIVINLQQKEAMSKKFAFSVAAKSRKKMGKKMANRCTNVMFAVGNLSIKKPYMQPKFGNCTVVANKLIAN